MSIRPFAIAAAVAAAALLTPVLTAPPVLAKDDPAAAAKAREEVRKDLKEAKKQPFADLSYVVDTTKLADGRWEFRDVPPPADPDQGTMFNATFPSGNATDASASITFVVGKCIQVNNQTKKEYSQQFKSIGKSVKMSQVEDYAKGLYQEWMATATDQIKDKCKETDKKSVGPSKYWGCAVGTDKELKKRVRKDWFVWVSNTSAGSWTWTAEATTSEKFIDNKDWLEKLDNLMKNIKELKDPRLK